MWSSSTICGIPCTWLRNPCSAYSGAKTIPERPARSEASTSVTLLPMGEMIPIPVMTTRRMGVLLLPRGQFAESATFMSFTR